jgi:hypothetical protein
MYNSYDYYDYSDSYSAYDGAAVGTALGMGMLSFMIVYISLIAIAIAVSVVEIIAMWKMFRKAGRQGWEAIVPFYNMWTLFEISGYRGSNIFFMFIPYAGVIILLVFEIKAAISLSQKFHKSGGFAALLVLVPVVGYSILGFGKDEYDGKLGVQRDNNTSKEEVKDETETSNNFCTECGAKLRKNQKHCTKCGKDV